MTEVTALPVVAPAGQLTPLQELTVKEHLFVNAFIRTSSVAAAGRIAKLGSGNNSCYAMYARPHVRAAIEARREEALAHSDVTVFRTLRELGAIAYQDPRTVLDQEGNVLPLSEWPDGAAASLASIEFEEERVRTIDGGWELIGRRIAKYKFHNKVSAIDMLMRHQGLYGEDNKQTGGAMVEAVVSLLQIASGTSFEPKPLPPAETTTEAAGDSEVARAGE